MLNTHVVRMHQGGEKENCFSQRCSGVSVGRLGRLVQEQD